MPGRYGAAIIPVRRRRAAVIPVGAGHHYAASCTSTGAGARRGAISADPNYDPSPLDVLQGSLEIICYAIEWARTNGGVDETIVPYWSFTTATACASWPPISSGSAMCSRRQSHRSPKRDCGVPSSSLPSKRISTAKPPSCDLRNGRPKAFRCLMGSMSGTVSSVGGYRAKVLSARRCNMRCHAGMR